MSMINDLWRRLDKEGGLLLVRQLLDLDPLQAMSSSYGFTLLHVVATEGDVDLAKCLLSAGVDVNAADSGGRTPLHQAADQRHAEMCQFLIQAGANPNKRDNAGRTPLQSAIGGDPWAEPEQARQTIAILQASQHGS